MITKNLEQITIKNASDVTTQVLPFVKIGEHKAKPRLAGKLIFDAGCDLKQAGYRVVQKDSKNILQIAFETRDLQTSWYKCETSVQFDTNHDGIADFEATNHVHFIPGLYNMLLTSLFFDGAKTRKIQRDYLKAAAQGDYVEYDYGPALIDGRDFISFDLNNFAILEINLDKAPNLETADIKISTSHQSNGSIQQDAFVRNRDAWFSPGWSLSAPTFTQESLNINPHSELKHSLSKDELMFVTSALK